MKKTLLVGLWGLASVLGCGGPTPTVQPEQQQQPALPSTPPTVLKGGIAFVERYAPGFEFAKRGERPMLIFFTAKWCGYCHQMVQDAFTDEAVVALSKKFVCILVDADREPEVCQEFDVRGYPTLQFMTSNGVPLNRLTGRRSAQQLLAQMEAALQAAAVRAQQTGRSILR